MRMVTSYLDRSMKKVTKTESKNNIIKYKILYTIIIILIYLIGRSLVLYRVDTSMYGEPSINAQILLMQTISGDINRMSLFALGISPYMISTIIVQVVSTCRKSDARAKSSPKKINLFTVVLTLVFAVFQAAIRANQLQYNCADEALILVKIIAALEMIAGVMVIMWLCERNKKYGVGGQSAIIFVNILSGIVTTLSGYAISSLIVPLAVSVVVMVVVLVMENAEKRIPVQRISIHNIYADKNYMAIKLNPIGIMPVMFAASFFMIPQMIMSGLGYIFPQNENIMWLQENMTLTNPFGIVVYIVILFALTVGFAVVFINPKEMTEQFLKSGDSLVNLRAGDETKKYLSKQIVGISCFSAAVMSICLGIPMLLQLQGNIEPSLVMFPSSIMMMTGIWCSLYRECITIRTFDSYKPFI